jgi:anaerobic selenocysteine-containing dehydrogenase
VTTLRTVFRTCTLCEAMCGLKLGLDGDRIISVRGDEDDPFSRGYICPKGVAIGEVHHDPDRLRTPLRRAPDGSFTPIGWDEAFDLVERRLGAVRATCGADAVAVYMGNPIIHNYGVILLRAGFARAVGSRNFIGPGSQDTSLSRVSRVRVLGWTREVPDFVEAVQPVQGVQPKIQFNRQERRKRKIREQPLHCAAAGPHL